MCIKSIAKYPVFYSRCPVLSAHLGLNRDYFIKTFVMKRSQTRGGEARVTEHNSSCRLALPRRGNIAVETPTEAPAVQLPRHVDPIIKDSISTTSPVHTSL